MVAGGSSEASVNRQWILASHPDGMPETDNWRLVKQPGPGQLLVRAHYLSVDPYRRGRISRRRNYAAGVQIGEVMTGGGVGELVASRHPDFAPGDIVESFTFGWQSYAVLGPTRTRRIDPGLAPIQGALSYLGMPEASAQTSLKLSLSFGRKTPVHLGQEKGEGQGLCGRPVLDLLRPRIL